mgnify:CR=1 FL=1
MMELLTGGGAAAGGGAASALGPVGALAGAAVGGTTSYMDRQSQKKKEKKARDEAMSIPGRGRMSKLYDAWREEQQIKQTSMAALSQAAMDWANIQR